MSLLSIKIFFMAVKFSCRNYFVNIGAINAQESVFSHDGPRSLGNSSFYFPLSREAPALPVRSIAPPIRPRSKSPFIFDQKGNLIGDIPYLIMDPSKNSKASTSFETLSNLRDYLV